MLSNYGTTAEKTIPNPRNPSQRITGRVSGATVDFFDTVSVIQRVTKETAEKAI